MPKKDKIVEVVRKKVKIKKFFEPVFGFKVTFVVGTREEVIQYLDNLNRHSHCADIIPLEARGAYTKITIGDSVQDIVWVDSCPYEGHIVIAHETFHLVAHLLDSVGIRFDIDNHEVYAYMYTYWIKKLTTAFSNMVEDR